MEFDVNDSSKMAENKSGEKPPDDYIPVTREELIDQLQHQVACFENLPQHVKESFCTNMDLAYFMTIILAIVKRI